MILGRTVMVCWENKRQEQYFVDALDRVIIDLMHLVDRVFDQKTHNPSPKVL